MMNPYQSPQLTQNNDQPTGEATPFQSLRTPSERDSKGYNRWGSPCLGRQISPFGIKMVTGYVNSNVYHWKYIGNTLIVQFPTDFKEYYYEKLSDYVWLLWGELSHVPWVEIGRLTARKSRFQTAKEFFGGREMADRKAHHSVVEDVSILHIPPTSCRQRSSGHRYLKQRFIMSLYGLYDSMTWVNTPNEILPMTWHFLLFLLLLLIIIIILIILIIIITSTMLLFHK